MAGGSLAGNASDKLATDKMSVVRTGRGYRAYGENAAFKRTARMRPSNGRLVQQSVPGTLPLFRLRTELRGQVWARSRNAA